jgi:hypothetical protein
MKIAGVVFWIIWSALAGSVMFFTLPPALIWIEPKLENAGPLIILVLIAEIAFAAVFPFIGANIANKIGWYPSTRINPPRRIFAVFCALLSLPVFIKIGYLWLAQGLGGSFGGFVFTVCSILQGLAIFLLIDSYEKP